MSDERPAPADHAQELELALERLLGVAAASLEQRANLEHALASRISIEQAKGILAERLRVDLDEAFELLRESARTERRTVHELARRVIDEPETPPPLLVRLTKRLERALEAGRDGSGRRS